MLDGAISTAKTTHELAPLASFSEKLPNVDEQLPKQPRRSCDMAKTAEKPLKENRKRKVDLLWVDVGNSLNEMLNSHSYR